MGGIYCLTDEQQAQHVPPHWLLYTAVDDVDAAADTTQQNGGAVVAPPMDVPNVGRMAVLQDPEGATFAVMRLAGHAGLGTKDTPGALCWIELSARDPQGAASFYGALFGWKAQTQQMPNGLYTMFSLGGTDVSGMIEMNEEWGTCRPRGCRTSESPISTRRSLGYRASVAKSPSGRWKRKASGASPSSEIRRARSCRSSNSTRSAEHGEARPGRPPISPRPHRRSFARDEYRARSRRP
jgi:predicted enzyme related to lactoylglutathione lyase